MVKLHPILYLYALFLSFIFFKKKKIYHEAGFPVGWKIVDGHFVNRAHSQGKGLSALIFFFIRPLKIAGVNVMLWTFNDL